MRRASEEEHEELVHEELEEQLRIDLLAGNRYRGQRQSPHLQECSLVHQARVREPVATRKSPRRWRRKKRQKSWGTRTIFLMTTTWRSQDMTLTCSRGARKMTSRLCKVR